MIWTQASGPLCLWQCLIYYLEKEYWHQSASHVPEFLFQSQEDQEVLPLFHELGCREKRSLVDVDKAPTKKSARVQAWHPRHQVGKRKEKAPVRVTERQNRGLLRSRSHPLLKQQGLWKVVFPISKLPSLSCTSCRQSSQLTLKRAGDGDRSYLASKDQRDAHHNTVLWALKKKLSRQIKFLSLNESANRDLT